MTDSPQPSPVTAASTSGASPEMIDASCRWPLLGLYYGAAFWLLVASVASLIASMSFHAPAMFADCAWFSYGRMAPLANDLLIYGFCVPAGWAAVLWLLARVGQTPLVNGAAVLFGTKIWNIGILLGSIGILSGGGSGVEALEFPLYAAWTLLLGAVLIGISGLNTLRARSEPLMHPVQWFAGLSILWFPWIYLTALIFLQMSPVRGMAQLQVVLLGLMGVAALFYFMPALRRDALASRQLAWFALITLILCGGWTGVPRTAPVPAWMAIISQVMCISLAVPVLAIILNLWHLRSADTPPEGRFFRFGIRSFILWTGGVVLLSGTGLWGTASFTLVDPALTQLLLQGFSVMVSLGVAYSVLPRIAGGALPFPRAARLHFWMAAVGILLVVVPFLAGGFRQGGSLAEVDIPFMEIASATLMPIRVGSMGQLLLIVGHGFLLLNVVALMIRFLHAQLKRFDNAPVTLAGTTEGRA